MPDIFDRVKDAISGHHPNRTGSTGTHDTYGSPHNTSGYDSSAHTHGPPTGAGAYGSGLNPGPTTGPGAYATGAETSNIHGSSNTGHYGSGKNPTVHESNLLNKVDPRVDSDRDHRGAQLPSDGGLGNNSTHHPSGGHNHGSSIPVSDSNIYSNSTHHSHPTGGHGYGSSNAVSGSGTYETITSGQSSYNQNTSKTGKATGPHGSDLLNKLDPRVDEKSNPVSQQRSGY